MKSLFDPKMIADAQEQNPFAKVSDIVYSIIESAIYSAHLEPGLKINVSKVAEDLNVSASPIRDALEALCEEGIVIAKRTSGGKQTNYYVFDLSEKDIVDLYDTRKAIEGSCAMICAQSNWQIDTALLRKYAMMFESKTISESPDAVIRIKNDRAFHSLIVHSTDNAYLIDLYDSLEKKLDYLSIRTNRFLIKDSKANKRRICTQHAAICHAIEMGFSEQARTALEEHIDFCSLCCLRTKNYI